MTEQEIMACVHSIPFAVGRSIGSGTVTAVTISSTGFLAFWTKMYYKNIQLDKKKKQNIDITDRIRRTFIKCSLAKDKNCLKHWSTLDRYLHTFHRYFRF